MNIQAPGTGTAGSGRAEHVVERRRVLHAMGVGGIALALPALLASCTAGTDSGGPAGTGGKGTDEEIDSVKWGVRSAVESLDVGTVPAVDGMIAMGLALEGLVALDADLKLKPSLAESWKTPDNLHHIFRLRQGVRFWDGTQLSAQDVLWSIQRHLDPGGASRIAGYFSNVASVRATGEHEITMTLRRPDPTVLYTLSFTFITPKKFSQKLGDKLGAPSGTVTTMGTGPYRVTSYSAESGITYKRFDTYWGERPKVRSAQLSFLTSQQSQLFAVRSGEVQGIFDFAVEQGKTWDGIGGVATQYAPGNRSLFLCFNMDTAPWDDVHVRRALLYAADRAGYIKAFLGGHGEVASSIVPKSHWWSILGKRETDKIYGKLTDYGYDLAAARRELAKSAHPDGFTADVEYPDHEPSVGRALVSLSEAVRDLGITLNVRERTRAEWGAKIDSRKGIGLYYLGLSPDYPDPVNFMTICLASKEAGGAYNLANFRDKRVQTLLTQQAALLKGSERAPLLAEILQIADEQVPYLPLWWQQSSLALKKDYVYEDFSSYHYVLPAFLGDVKARA